MSGTCKKSLHYLPTETTWVQVNCSGSKPEQLYQHSAVVHDNCMIIYGGENQKGFWRNIMYTINLGNFM